MASNVKDGHGELPSMPVPICSAGSPMIRTGLGFPDVRLNAKARTVPGKLGWLDTLAARPLDYMEQILFLTDRAKCIASLWVYIMRRPDHATLGAQCLDTRLLSTPLWVMGKTATPVPPTHPMLIPPIPLREYTYVAFLSMGLIMIL